MTEFDPKDVTFEVFRTAGGPGAANTMQVRATHRPTGITGTVTAHGYRASHPATEQEARVVALRQLTAAVAAT